MFPNTAITVHATGAVEPTEAWRRWYDLDTWPNWSPQIAEVRADRRRLAPGLTGRVISVVGLSATFEVLDVDRRRHRWSWRVHALGLTFDMDHRNDPAANRAGSGTTTTWRIHGFAPAVLAYAPLAKLALRRLVRP